MSTETTTITQADVHEEEGSAGTFLAAAFDKLKADGSFPSTSDETADVPVPETTAPATDEKPKPAEAAAPATTEVETETADPFSAASLLGVEPAEESEPDPAATATETEEVVPDDVKANPKAAAAWVKTRAELKTAKQALAERDREIAELKAVKPADPEELTKLRADNERLENEVAVKRVQASKYYRDAVGVPKAQLRSAAEALAEKAGDGVTADQLVAALENPEGEALSDIAAGLGEFDRVRLYRLAEESSRIARTEQIVIENAREADQRIQAKEEAEKAAYKEAQAQEYAKELENYRQQVAPHLPFLKKVEGADDWNRRMDDLDAFARGVDVDSLPQKARAELVYRAGLVQPVLTLLTTLQKEHAAALAQIKRLRKADPGMAAGNAGEEIVADTEDEELGFAEVMSKRLK